MAPTPRRACRRWRRRRGPWRSSRRGPAAPQRSPTGTARPASPPTRGGAGPWATMRGPRREGGSRERAPRRAAGRYRRAGGDGIRPEGAVQEAAARGRGAPGDARDHRKRPGHRPEPADERGGAAIVSSLRPKWRLVGLLAPMGMAKSGHGYASAALERPESAGRGEEGAPATAPTRGRHPRPRTTCCATGAAGATSGPGGRTGPGSPTSRSSASLPERRTPRR